MRTARPPPLQNPKRGPHGGLRVHRRLVQPPSPPFRPRLSFTDQLRKDSANRKSNRKPNTVHLNGVAPHVERLRTDEVVQAILGVQRMPSAMTLTRYFGGLVRSQIEHLSEVLGQFVLGRLRAPALGALLDLDSTVFERYGRQQGSLKGYNPRKHGRPSHHPLLAMLAEAKVVLQAWLRSGNTASARGVKAFLAETLARLPPDFRLYALRADTGFFVTEFLVESERRALPYAIAVRMNPHLRRTVAGIGQRTPRSRRGCL